MHVTSDVPTPDTKINSEVIVDATIAKLGAAISTVVTAATDVSARDTAGAAANPGRTARYDKLHVT